MVNFCLDDKEKSLLKSLIGKKLIKAKHDPFDKFGGETVYGRIELFFEGLVVLIDYDYGPYRLFGSEDDDHPRFSVKAIDESEAVSALQNVDQIYVNYGETVEGVTLVEDATNVEWDGKRDEFKTLIAIVFKLPGRELGIQGDYMIPLLNLLRGEDVKTLLPKPGEEFDGDPETKFDSKRSYIRI